jgi:hypothetical protein
VSYHHDNDQYYYNLFTASFSQSYDIFTDRSLREAIESQNAEYIKRTIREDYITGSSLTVVLCGAETWKRKFVDWEIHATLLKQHALLGILLPTFRYNYAGRCIVPHRLFDNIQSGYAHWIAWPQSTGDLQSAINVAIRNAERTWFIDNRREQMHRNMS